jgi:hypothetical protein
MRQQFLALIFSVLTLGCPVSYRAHRLSRSAATVFLAPPWDAEWANAIASGRTVEIHWYQPCVMIVDSDHTYYFQSLPLPHGIARPRLMRVDLDAEYKDGTLVVIDDRGAKHELHRLSSCDA